METSTKNSLHIRCNSLPSSPHPLEGNLIPNKFQEHLQRLKDSEATSTSLSSSSKKGLRQLKGMKNNSSSSKDNEVLSILGMLKEAEPVTMRSLEFLWLFVSDPNGQSKQRRWSIISKLMQPHRMTCDSQESDSNEFVTVDTALQSLITRKPLSVENLHSHVENLEICIEDLEVGVEHLLRQLIRTRASLLNIFSH
uniref:Uncharacterized protein n=1 Tax=Cajanus cajan TaxID=3821 RepID=A0A151TG91_CAJCA|nr:hypothetical protein KK1_012358 [Cajanus cajan]KYP66097.1 hypothetical protein KK1_012381 [Cajanus cajan]